MNQDYLATGFTNVDHMRNQAIYSDCLSLLDSLPYFKTYKQETYRLLKLSPGLTVLEAGCGLGHDAYRIAKKIGERGHVVGLDASAIMIKNAILNQKNDTLPITFQHGNIKEIPFPNHTFDRCRVDRVLQHVPQPDIAVSELVRVLKPGGILLAYDNDWGTFTITSHQTQTTRMLENLWCDAFTNGWIGRYLQPYFIKEKLRDVTIYPSTSILTNIELADQVYNLRETVHRAIAKGLMSEEQGKKWIDELVEQSENQCFAVGLTAYTVIGRKSTQ